VLGEAEMPSASNSWEMVVLVRRDQRKPVMDRRRCRVPGGNAGTRLSGAFFRQRCDRRRRVHLTADHIPVEKLLTAACNSMRVHAEEIAQQGVATVAQLHGAVRPIHNGYSPATHLVDVENAHKAVLKRARLGFVQYEPASHLRDEVRRSRRRGRRRAGQNPGPLEPSNGDALRPYQRSAHPSSDGPLRREPPQNAEDPEEGHK
jgi:hypothetical protein